MKINQLNYLLFFLLIFGTLSIQSCSSESSENDCPLGYLGTNCDQFDPTEVQTLLGLGQTPKALFDGGISLESLYGKTYRGGFIFYLDTDSGIGMIAATEDQSDDAEWGCSPRSDSQATGSSIGDGATNTDAILEECPNEVIAAKFCRDLGPDWFLPSRGELNLMYVNLFLNGHGGMTECCYWTSTEFDEREAWAHRFSDNKQDGALKSGNSRYVRAARFF